MGKKGLIILSIVLGAVALSALSLAGYEVLEKEGYKMTLENRSRKSYYDLVTEVNDMDVKLNKIALSTSAEYQREQLLEVWRIADSAQANVADLSSGNDLLLNTVKFVNQAGDYCKYLEKRIVNSKTALTDAEKEALKSLAETNANVKSELNSFDINASGVKLSEFDDNGATPLLSTMNENVDVSIDYPELIYDGPFSDSMLNREPKLNEREYSEKEASDYVAAVFGIADRSDIEYKGVQDGKFSTYNYTFGNCFAQVTVKGAKLLSFNAEHTVEEEKLTQSECVSRAKAFVERAGYDSVKDVWISDYNGVMFINFVYETDGVICYSDMLKVKVASDTGAIVGFDAQEYLINHAQTRLIDQPTVIEDEIRANVPEGMLVQNLTLALVPKGKSEVLTYEIYGQYNGTDYFVYVDAQTGEETEILQVIDGENGRLLV